MTDDTATGHQTRHNSKFCGSKTESHSRIQCLNIIVNIVNFTLNKTYRNDPHLLGGTRESVLGEVLRRDVLNQEFLLTSPRLSVSGDCEFRSVISLYTGQEKDKI